MKRIKAMNGYTIYMLTARDEKNGEGFEGEYAIYFSSDVRDYGREFSVAEFDGVGSLEEAESLCNNNYAKARELVEEVQTLYDFEEVEAIEARLNAGESCQAIRQELNQDEEETDTDNTETQPKEGENMRNYEEIKDRLEAEKKDAIIEALEGLSYGEAVSVWNNYTEEMRYYDDRIFYMSELDELYSSFKPSELLDMVGHNFNVSHNYFVESIYGLESSDDPAEIGLDFDDVARYVEENGEDLGEPDISDVLEEFGELFEALETLEELETAEDLDEDEAEELEEVKDTLKAYL